MSVTEHSLRRSEPSAPKPRPGRTARVDELGRVTLRSAAEHTEVAWLGDTETASAAPSLTPLSVGVDELGQCVVEDVLGAVYGVGRTPEEAHQDYFMALSDRLAYMRARRGSLAARLARQLDALEELFPNR